MKFTHHVTEKELVRCQNVILLFILFSVCFNRKDEMKDVLKRMDGFELKGRKLELRPVSITHMISYDSYGMSHIYGKF